MIWSVMHPFEGTELTPFKVFLQLVCCYHLMPLHPAHQLVYFKMNVMLDNNLFEFFPTSSILTVDQLTHSRP